MSELIDNKMKLTLIMMNTSAFYLGVALSVALKRLITSNPSSFSTLQWSGGFIAFIGLIISLILIYYSNKKPSRN